ncbi:hypothetical protein D9M71_772400 [compost metagenome]
MKENNQRGDQCRRAKEHHYLHQAIDEVTDQLGEANDVDAVVVSRLGIDLLLQVLSHLEFVAHLFFQEGR